MNYIRRPITALKHDQSGNNAFVEVSSTYSTIQRVSISWISNPISELIFFFFSTTAYQLFHIKHTSLYKKVQDSGYGGHMNSYAASLLCSEMHTLDLPDVSMNPPRTKQSHQHQCQKEVRMDFSCIFTKRETHEHHRIHPLISLDWFFSSGQGPLKQFPVTTDIFFYSIYHFAYL